MQLTFDGSTESALRMAETRNAIRSIHKQAAELKTGGPMKEPPKVPPLNRNPRRHDVVAWRHDGRIDSERFDTKEMAQEYAKALSWVIYYQYMVMDGRDMVEKHSIDIPSGFALDDNGLPVMVVFPRNVTCET